MKPKFSVLPLWQGFTSGDSDIKVRPFLIAAIISASLASTLVMTQAGAHDDDEKAVPKTCEQLADTKRYISDVAYPEVKKLKEQCAATSKKPAATSSSTPR